MHSNYSVVLFCIENHKLIFISIAGLVIWNIHHIACKKKSTIRLKPPFLHCWKEESRKHSTWHSSGTRQSYDRDPYWYSRKLSTKGFTLITSTKKGELKATVVKSTTTGERCNSGQLREQNSRRNNGNTPITVHLRDQWTSSPDADYISSDFIVRQAMILSFVLTFCKCFTAHLYAIQMYKLFSFRFWYQLWIND